VKSTGLPSFNAGSKRQVPTVLTASSFETPTSCLDHLDIVWQSVRPDHYAEHYSSRARAIFALSEHSGSGSYVSLGSMTPNNKVVVAIANKPARIAWAVSFPQGKVPFSTPVAYPFLGSFRAQCTIVVTSQSGLTERSTAKTAPHLLLHSQAGRSFIMHCPMGWYFGFSQPSSNISVLSEKGGNMPMKRLYFCDGTPQRLASLRIS
jgi:hypothetical protein